MKSPKKQFRLPRVSANISTVQQYLVWKFCENAATINWPKEIKIATKLLSLYPEFEFWQSAELNFKMESLCYFLGEKGLNQLKFFYLKFKYRLPDKDKPEPFKEKIGDDFSQKEIKKFFNFKRYH